MKKKNLGLGEGVIWIFRHSKEPPFKFEFLLETFSPFVPRTLAH